LYAFPVSDLGVYGFAATVMKFVGVFDIFVAPLPCRDVPVIFSSKITSGRIAGQ
jgi:hypothetical protein